MNISDLSSDSVKVYALGKGDSFYILNIGYVDTDDDMQEAEITLFTEEDLKLTLDRAMEIAEANKLKISYMVRHVIISDMYNKDTRVRH